MNFSMDIIRLEVLEKVCNFDMFCKMYLTNNSCAKEWISHDVRLYRHNVKVEESFELDLPKNFLIMKNRGVRLVLISFGWGIGTTPRI